MKQMSEIQDLRHREYLPIEANKDITGCLM